MIHIYCGDGKGKTTAAVGLAARMAGRNGRVRIVQFLKDGGSGEINFLKSDKIEVRCTDKNYGFYKSMSPADKAEITECHNKNLREALSDLDGLDMLVLDEIFAALNFGLTDEALVKSVIEKRGGAEIVMTGRDPDAYFLEKADYVSEIKKIKHPYDRGIGARKGVEF